MKMVHGSLVVIILQGWRMCAVVQPIGFWACLMMPDAVLLIHRSWRKALTHNLKRCVETTIASTRKAKKS